jgi:uncharacterized repeat protein (TIGR02543 family)
MKAFNLVFVFSLFFVILFLFGCVTQPVCGNGVCESGEDENNCSSDCGVIDLNCSTLGGEKCGDFQVCDGEIITQSKDTQRCCSGECKLPESFDWRDKHGENWITVGKNQGSLNSCGAFSAIGTAEAVINLYYNQHLDLDLSEQQLFDCRYPEYHSEKEACISCFISDSVCSLITHGAIPETCNPYTNAFGGVCDKNACPNINETTWKFTDYYNLALTPNPAGCQYPEKAEDINEEKVKKLLIEKGPLALMLFYSEIGMRGHGLVLVGYDSNSDGTYWILKNSWGLQTSEGDACFKYKIPIREIEGISSVVALIKPIPPTDSNYVIVCQDKDSDQFCNWGITKEMPNTCPSYCKKEKDWDDSNSKIGALGKYDCNNCEAPVPICGDGICDDGETELNCFDDCEIIHYCSGVVPSNSTICSEDNNNLTTDVAISLVNTCDSPKCEYVCNEGFTKSEDVCLSNSTYVVGYNGNGNDRGVVPVDLNGPYAQGNVVKVLENIGSISKPNFYFAGWNTQANGFGIDYVPGSSFVIDSNNVNLYAKWVAFSSDTPNVWVTNLESNNVSRVQLSSPQGVVGSYPTGLSPYGVAVDYTDNAWVTNYNSNSVSKFDKFGNLIGTYPVGIKPMGIVVDAGGNIWVANKGDLAGTSSISKLSGITGSLIDSYKISGTNIIFSNLAVDNKNKVWVTDEYNNDIYTVDCSSGEIFMVYHSPDFVGGIALDNIEKIWITNRDSSSVSKLNSNNGEFIETYSIGDGIYPNWIAADASNNIWVLGEGGWNIVSKLNINTGELIGSYNTGGASITSVSIDSNENIWAINMTSNNVSKLSNNGDLLNSYTVGTYPSSLGDATGFTLKRLVNKKAFPPLEYE